MTWFRLDDDDFERLLEVAPPSIAERLQMYVAPEANLQNYRDQIVTDDDLEVDPDAHTSLCEDGCWVMTWSWVSKS